MFFDDYILLLPFSHLPSLLPLVSVSVPFGRLPPPPHNSHPRRVCKLLPRGTKTAEGGEKNPTPHDRGEIGHA